MVIIFERRLTNRCGILLLSDTLRMLALLTTAPNAMRACSPNGNFNYKNVATSLRHQRPSTENFLWENILYSSYYELSTDAIRCSKT